jgi:hypothetical protein
VNGDHFSMFSAQCVSWPPVSSVVMMVSDKVLLQLPDLNEKLRAGCEILESSMTI